MIIAIDGPSSSGKSTLARDLANKLEWIYIDTGAMYRTVALYCIQNDIAPESLQPDQVNNIKISLAPTETGTKVLLNGVDVSKEIRSLPVSNIVSDIAIIPFVREKLVEQQRTLAHNADVVMDGRDIGSVVFPDAEYKFFVTASIDTRAQRRYDEMLRKNNRSATIGEVKANLLKRDHIDSNRAISPLVQCKDALYIDNTNLSREDQLDHVMKLISFETPT